MNYQFHAIKHNGYRWIFILVTSLIILSDGSYGSPLLATIAQHASLNPVKATCPFFILDVSSLVKYKLCVRLMQSKVYEGRGGKKFVRIRPNSLLEDLYPCSQHSPNRCLICKETFRDHLLSWWMPHLNSPYDKYIDNLLLHNSQRSSCDCGRESNNDQPSSSDLRSSGKKQRSHSGKMKAR
uniref:Uncharacterized protein n=1 Tax=Proboscia inermis TaxID=420281 RepID=A0A7S0CEK4_9STRA